MNTYITNAYDFHDAISKSNTNVDIIIIKTKIITDSITLVTTNVGKYWCESFGIDRTIYMEVTQYLD